MPGSKDIPSRFPEDKILYLTTRQDFTAQHEADLLAVCDNASPDWAVVFEQAVIGHVAPLVHHNLAKLPQVKTLVPAEILSCFKRAQIDNILLKKDARQALSEAVCWFNQRGIEIMLVKGAALNLLVYSQPWYTLSWDIDLVTRPVREALKPELLAEVDRTFDRRNSQIGRYNTKVEYDFYAHHDITMNGILPLDMERIWKDSVPLEVGSGQVKVMSTEDMLIAAAISALRKRYFMLKNLCDLAEIVHRCPKIDWDLVAGKARAYRCGAIVYAALNVTLNTLTAPIPPGLFESLQVPSSQRAIIERLARIAVEKVSLQRLSAQSSWTFLTRNLSWPLLLSYASYRPDQAGRIIRTLIKNRFLKNSRKIF